MTVAGPSALTLTRGMRVRRGFWTLLGTLDQKPFLALFRVADEIDRRALKQGLAGSIHKEFKALLRQRRQILTGILERLREAGPGG